MANAKRCDICGGYYPYEFNVINGISYLYDTASATRFKRNVIDCCPDCISRFNALIDQIKEENGFDRGGEK